MRVSSAGTDVAVTAEEFEAAFQMKGKTHSYGPAMMQDGKAA